MYVDVCMHAYIHVCMCVCVYVCVYDRGLASGGFSRGVGSFISSMGVAPRLMPLVAASSGLALATPFILLLVRARMLVCAYADRVIGA